MFIGWLLSLGAFELGPLALNTCAGLPVLDQMRPMRIGQCPSYMPSATDGQ